MHPLMNIAIRSARSAGQIILRYYRQGLDLEIESKGPSDFVTQVDKQAEEAIISTVRRSYPDHAFLGEESGSSGQSSVRWIIDPLDGTNNFIHGFPHFSISIAVEESGVLSQAVVYDPVRDELFTAGRGEGAQLDGRRIRVAPLRDPRLALIGTGVPFRDKMYLEAYMGMFREVVRDCGGLRRAGSAALDLSYVAAGRLDGFWEFGLSPWDIAAGVLLIQEAGGIITHLGGGPVQLNQGHILTANPTIHRALSTAFAPYIPEDIKPDSLKSYG